MSKVSNEVQVERNEVITLSSNESVLEKESMRSSETERCRVTWEKKRKSDESKIPFETPSPEKKVKQWMKNQHMFFVQKELNSNRNIPLSSQHLDSLTNNAINICSKKESCRPTKSVLIRQDYVKFSNTECGPGTSSAAAIVKLNYRDNRYSESDSGCSTNNYSCKYNINNNNDDDDDDDDDDGTHKIKDCSKLKDESNRFNENTSINLMNGCSNFSRSLVKKSNLSIHEKNCRGKLHREKSKPMDQPLSPESQKKNELCSYLQLMNTHGRKNREFLQNRRSIRVINHQKLLERRETEKVFKCEKLEKSSTEISEENSKNNSDVAKICGSSATRKSFADLNLKSLAPSWVQNRSVNVRNGSRSLKRVVPIKNESNFEDIMQTFLITENEKLFGNGRNSSTGMANTKITNAPHSNETEETRKLLEALKKNNSPALNEKICDQLEQYLSQYDPLENYTEETYNVKTKSKTRRSLRLVHNNNSFTKSSSNNSNKCQDFVWKKQLNPYKNRVDYKINSNHSLPKVINDCKDLTLNRTSNNKLCVEMTDNVPSINVPCLLKEKLKSQFELIKNLTPEHRKALFDSTKFTGINQIRSMFVFPNNHKEVLEFHCDDLTCNGFKLSEKIFSEKASVTLNEILNVLETQVTHSQRKLELKIAEPTISKQQREIETRNKTNILEKNIYYVLPDSNMSEIEVRNYSLSAKEDISKQQSEDSQVSTNSSAARVGSGSSTLCAIPRNQNSLLSTVMSPDLSYVALPSNVQNQLLPVRRKSSEINSSCTTVSSSNSKPLNTYLSRKHRSKITIDSSLQTCDNNDDEVEISSNKIQSRFQAVQPVMLAKNKGLVEHAYYFDFTLVVVQELSVSFWKVCPLGNILGVHDMWEAKGDVHRLVSDDSTDKTVTETVTYMDKSVAYFEMWTKINDTGALDVIVVIYFWLECFSQPSRKIVLLDSVKCKDADVIYMVLKRSRKIFVATCAIVAGVPTTFLNNHHLASDYQSIASTKQMGCVNYHVRTMHNIQDCDTLIMGCGEQKITLWNVEYGFVVATIDLLGFNEIPQTLWTKCDRGFLFVLQQFSDTSLKLIAINGINYTWKLLRSFQPNDTCGSLQGVCVENGLLVAFFDNVSLCWKIENREEILELPCDDNLKVFVSDSNVISVSNDQLQVKNALQYLLTCDDIYNTKV
ncbi:uncharacterized protein DDB_G0283697-like isoform X1 [Agrilus planipennis]|nr:uncharacterized protein DDB_G0283697-like isoform X1 [Agrilus planipennis]XP_018330593.1 uncharacterized protein DDB_G0283697-like isoform X1 [Agrilus planipennis]